MKQTDDGYLLFEVDEIIEAFYQNPRIDFADFVVTHNSGDTYSDVLLYNQSLNNFYMTDDYKTIDCKNRLPTHEENQSKWKIPEEYNIDDDKFAEWILSKCTGDAEIQRCGQELLMFQERNMFPLLKYLRYFVDIMHKNNVVWGVGRGSSVASFVLFLIGIHRINSLFYDLDIGEFLR